MKIGLLMIAAALLSAQYVKGVDVRTRTNVRSNSTNSTGGTTNSTTHTHTHTHNSVNSAGTTTPQTNPTTHTQTTTCTYEKFKKVVTVQTDDKSIVKNELFFHSSAWLKDFVKDRLKD